jgi:FtsH-binding integral membrane protein
MLQYWSRSIYSFLGLALLAGGFAWLLSSLPLNEAGSYRWILIVVTVGYIIFLAMMTTMRRIVEFAQREEWNHPRIRNREQRDDRDRHIK